MHRREPHGTCMCEVLELIEGTLLPDTGPSGKQAESVSRLRPKAENGEPKVFYKKMQVRSSCILEDEHFNLLARPITTVTLQSFCRTARRRRIHKGFLLNIKKWPLFRRPLLVPLFAWPAGSFSRNMMLVVFWEVGVFSRRWPVPAKSTQMPRPRQSFIKGSLL